MASNSELRRDNAWRIVLASCVGCALGLTALPFYSMGIFAKPLAAEFGWSRAVVQSGLSFALLGVVSSAWFAGWLVDKIGVRKVALGSQAGLALGFLALAAQNGNPYLWYANWFLLAVFGVGTTPLTWSRGIAGWFDTQRGLALGIALTGTGITAFAAPLLLTPLIAEHGWRVGYLAIALAIMILAMPVIALLFREKAQASSLGVGQPADQGVMLNEALRSRQFWLILFAFALVTVAVAGTIPNLIPMLTDGGIDPATAAGYASLLGLNVILGRLLAGWLLDRYWAPAVAVAILMPPAFACLLLSWQLWPIVAVALIGLAGGAEFDLIAFLCLRYFGTKNYGQIYAWQWAGFSGASAIGPIVFAGIFDATGSYNNALIAAASLMVAGPLLLLGLGRYPVFAKAA